MNAAANVARDFKVEAAVGFAGLIGKWHQGFFRRAATFLDVAADAGTDDILPGVAAAA